MPFQLVSRIRLLAHVVRTRRPRHLVNKDYRVPEATVRLNERPLDVRKHHPKGPRALLLEHPHLRRTFLARS